MSKRDGHGYITLSKVEHNMIRRELELYIKEPLQVERTIKYLTDLKDYGIGYISFKLNVDMGIMSLTQTHRLNPHQIITLVRVNRAYLEGRGIDYEVEIDRDACYDILKRLQEDSMGGVNPEEVEHIEALQNKDYLNISSCFGAISHFEILEDGKTFMKEYELNDKTV